MRLLLAFLLVAVIGFVQAETDFMTLFDYQQFTLPYNGKRYTLVKTREVEHGSQANRYCQTHFHHVLAHIPDRPMLVRLSSALMNMQVNQDVEFREIGTAMRTSKDEHYLPEFEELNYAGRQCAVLGAWNETQQLFVDGAEFVLMSKSCNHKRFFLCEEPGTAALTYPTYKFTLGYNQRNYTLIASRDMNHGGRANDYCYVFHGQRLARIPDQATLTRLSDQIMRMQTNYDYPMREIATAERTTLEIHDLPTFDDLNAAGRQCAVLGAWDAESQSFSGDSLKLLSKTCNAERTILCEDYAYCAASAVPE